MLSAQLESLDSVNKELFLGVACNPSLTLILAAEIKVLEGFLINTSINENESADSYCRKVLKYQTQIHCYNELLTLLNETQRLTKQGIRR